MAKKKAGESRAPTETPEKPVEKQRVAEEEKPSDAGGMPIVGIGASAGGLEAMSELLKSLPEDFDPPIVVVQHLAPHQKSALPALLHQASRLETVQATDGMPLEPARVHVIPPNRSLRIEEGRLRISPRPETHERFSPIDVFFSSLAQHAGHRAIGVVLSGTASDGAEGLREIKARGGITFAQMPESAKHDGMPRAAIATGIVDFVLTPAEIAEELGVLDGHPYLSAEARQKAEDPIEVGEKALPAILKMLRKSTGVDFTQYKTATIKRRLQRRLVLHRLTDVSDYVKLLEESPSELHKLYEDILIHVTRFFRDPESFQALAKHAYPAIVARANGDEPIRVWIPGCSTGEEAYSVAIALVEFLKDDAHLRSVQIFGTDVSEDAINRARAGLYSGRIAEDVSPQRLSRFFTAQHEGYKVKKSLRDLCVFARQDLAQDPPFSRIDLIVCRNVLIYMSPPLQRRILAIFHYALRKDGFLMLGSAETVGLQGEGFAFVDKEHRLFRKKHGGARGAFQTMPRAGSLGKRPKVATEHDLLFTRSVVDEAHRLMLDRYVPASVLVDDELQIVQTRGRTGRYLELPPGAPALDVLKMSREGLLHPLREALEEARAQQHLVRKPGLRVRTNDSFSDVDLEVVPVGRGERHYLIVFERDASSKAHVSAAEVSDGPVDPHAPGVSEGPDRIVQLENELVSTRQYLQSTIQDVEAANEELQSANEEILSSNEELQSTNEELDTAKEELQATNEELNTINDELHGRNEELSRANADLMNLFASVDVAIVIVTDDMIVRRFTSAAERLFNLIPSDVGRPISQIRPSFDFPGLQALIREAVDSVSTLQRQVTDEAGRPHLLRVRPYKDADSRIDGAVVALFPLDSAGNDPLRLASAVLDMADSALAIVGADLTVTAANEPFLRAMGFSRDELVGRALDEALGERADGSRLRAILGAVLDDGRALERARLRLKSTDPSEIELALTARRVDGQDRPARALLRVHGHPSEAERGG